MTIQILYDHTLTCADLVLLCFKIRTLNYWCNLRSTSRSQSYDMLTYIMPSLGFPPVSWAVLSNQIIA